MEDSQLATLQDAISKSLVELTRTSTQLAAQDLGYFRVSHPKEAKQLNKSSTKILQLSRKLLHTAVGETTFSIPSYSDVDSLEDSWPTIVEVIDNLLEKTDVTLDEFTGVIKRQDADNDASQRAQERQLHAKQSTIPKPQLLFRKQPQNRPASAFKPLLHTKPHARIPLSESLTISPTPEAKEQYDANFYLCIKECSPLRTVIDATFRYKHPYQIEIDQYQFPPAVRASHEPIPFTPVADTKAIFVDTPEAVAEMVAELKQATEIAVDIEHHDKHSYIGLVSLMQISTRDKDWIIDTLQPWRDELQVLNEVFADPSILKVSRQS
jgi:exosome complex exonuclease RRP6